MTSALGASLLILWIAVGVVEGVLNVSGSRRATWLSLPNAITCVRLVFIAPLAIAVLEHTPGPWTAIGVAVWAGTDWVDGALARRLGQESELGRILDPVADRLGIAALTVALAATGAIGWYAPVVVLAVDVSVAALTAHAARAGSMRVTNIGKVRSAVLFVALIGASLISGGVAALAPAVAVVTAVGVALHAVAGARYVWLARAKVRR